MFVTNKKNMKQEFKIIAPTMPDFIHYEKPAGKRQDGLTIPEGVPIEKLSEEDALNFAELLSSTFVQHWLSKQPEKQKCYKTNEVCKYNCDGLCKESV